MEGNLDAELLRQLESAEATNDRVQAVFSIRPPDPTRRFATPEETDELAHELIHRVEEAVGQPPADYNIFRNLGSFVVEASPEYLRNLLDQDEVASALANNRSRTSK
jgi:hypothetical protein